MARIDFAPEAEQDGRDIASDLSRIAGPVVAARYMSRIETTIARLADFPGIGAPRPNYGPTMRITTVWPYVIFYRYSRDEDIVRIMRILHGRRDITAKMFRTS